MSADKQINEILADIRSLNGRSEPEQRAILSRIECALHALPGQERNPDLGPWTVSPDGLLISSETFDHDVQLRVKGDFYGPEDRFAYACRLVEQLNGAKSLKDGLPKEPPPGLLVSMAMRYRHDFGLDHDDTSPMTSGVTHEERLAILRTMRQLYEEVAGHGFFTW